jgi:TorA maturation chaperone TorD
MDDKDQKDKPIDEDFLMALIAGENTTNKSPEKEETKEKKETASAKNSRSKHITIQDYEHLFLKSTDTAARNGKSVYIRPEFHERLTRIVQIIGEDKLTIYAYLDNILEYHFQQFGEQIIKSFNEKYKPIL